MDALAFVLWVFTLVAIASLLFNRALAWSRRRRRSQNDHAPSAEAADTSDFQQLAGQLSELGTEIASAIGAHGVLTVEWLEQSPPFRAGLNLLIEAPGATLLGLAKHPNRWVSYFALARSASAPEMPTEFTDWALRAVKSTDYVQDVFLFRALVRHASRPVIGSALAKIDEGISKETLARFIGERRSGGEVFDEGVLQKNLPMRLAGDVETMLDEHEALLGPEFRTIFETWRQRTVDTAFLEEFGKLWVRPYDVPHVLLTGRRAEVAELISAELTSKPRRSVLLVGEHGVGKTALLRAAIATVGEWLVVFESTAARLNAGAVYIGELEGRVKELVERSRGKPLVWHLPNLEEALWAGQHSRSPRGLLDALLPAVIAGELTIVAEASPEGAARLLSERPQTASAFAVIQLRPLEEDEAVEVAAHMLRDDGRRVHASRETLRSAYELAQQFLPRTAPPGNMLALLRGAVQDAVDEGRDEIGHAQLIDALAHSSGLPLAILDGSTALRLEEVRSFFNERILGQPEPVEAVVERIALIKAGLTDVTRPLGVFFFVGPTGTGKTEIAKALAEFLFGSSDRMVRLDMSEYRTPESLDRLLADTGIDAHGAPLISAIRKNPFSVILLDEFEKAAPPIWDLFLQVFDHGRLTDTHGRTVDLRRCVIILTSNVGSAISTRERLGFGSASERFRPEFVTRELERSFRPEFLNRLDRVVLFRPFERSQMRALLDKELRDALTRRGLRGRPWAVELDDSAYEFLIDQGFSPSLGARPLKRALERHLLAPLASAIVEQTAPSGDQFLLVSAPAGERIEVRFIDPDADDQELSQPDGAGDLAVPAELDLRTIALTPRAGTATTALLLSELHRISTAVREDGMQHRKAEALAAMQTPGFWDDDTRFETLAEIEYIDRLETALETAERLGQRLARNGEGDRGARVQELIAVRLYILEQAIGGLCDDAPLDVFLRIRLAGERTGVDDSGFISMLSQMYTQWGERRGMRLEVLENAPGTHVVAVSGLGCGAILLREAGLHVLELIVQKDGGGQDFERVNALVEVAPCAPGPPVRGAERLRHAHEALAREQMTPAVVRRYRLPPESLVRDAVRGYRTGKLEQVLAGDFDLF